MIIDDYFTSKPHEAQTYVYNAICWKWLYDKLVMDIFRSINLQQLKHVATIISPSAKCWRATNEAISGGGLCHSMVTVATMGWPNMGDLLPYGCVSKPIIINVSGVTPIYQLFWCSPGLQGFDPKPYVFTLSSNFCNMDFLSGFTGPF